MEEKILQAKRIVDALYEHMLGVRPWSTESSNALGELARYKTTDEQMFNMIIDMLNERRRNDKRNRKQSSSRTNRK